MKKIFGKKNILKFGTCDESVDGIGLAKKHIPDWYKNTKPHNYNNLDFDSSNFPIKNLKNCIPFLDSLTSGYMIELWCDVHFKILDKENSIHSVIWGQAHPAPLALRDDQQNKLLPIPAGFESTHYIWQLPLSIKTPKGYSVIATHPFNRYDLPFITLTGIIDSENNVGGGNIPFFIRKDFEGTIKKGTPIMQIIPFKRENWRVERDQDVYAEGKINSTRSLNTFFGYYKNNWWNKKVYE